jgi:hypothetical protein
VPDESATDAGVIPRATGHWFAARDRATAEAIADALTAFGYAEVGTRPTRRRYLLEDGIGW